jgi:holo-[acyl-carrier protein] synthase
MDMVFGLGVDLVETKRIEKSIARLGGRFLKRLYSESEIAYCQQKLQPSMHFAACFAVKEAFLKALGVGLGAGFDLSEIETIHNAQGKPSIRLSGKAEQTLLGLGVSNTLVSISHCEEYATAVVILDKGKNVHGFE